MATFKLIGTITPDAASNTSLTSAFSMPGEFSHFAIEIPASMCASGVGNIRVMSANTPTGTYRHVVYSNNPATATSGNQYAGEMSSTSIASGAFVINEGLQFATYLKLQFTSTATANTGINLYGRKFG